MNKKTNVDLNSALAQSKANIYRQASMAIMAIVVCIVLCFALTVAWYTNILHTSDLAFKAKDWDFKFEGDITIGSDEGIYAAPGESGIVPLSLKNMTDESNELASDTDVTTIGVKVNVDKSDLLLLEQRLYFYVDDQQTIQEEVVEKQYLTTNLAYTYTVYPGQELKVSEGYSNQPQLRWEWVYDVVGYYVYADMNSSKLDIIEYMRPIEYDTDKAIYDTKGNLVSVDGVEVDTFIQENYLKNDGFEGSEIVKENGYYKVSENIYIVLCTLDQINTNNELDAALANASNEEGYPARLILTGQKIKENYIRVTTSEEIVTNINKGYNVIELQGDTTLVDDLVIEKGTDVILDLNGYTLIQEATITANEGSSISFMNGTIQASEQLEKPVLVNATSAEVYFDNVIVADFYSGIEINDSKNYTDSYISISNSEFTTQDSCVWLRGNGDNSGRKTTLIIETSTLTSSEYVPVGVNGSSNMSGTSTTIYKSTLTGKYTAVYHPATNSDLLIKESTLTGDTGIVIKAGYVTVENSKIKGIGPNVAPSFNKSGFSVTGDGIYIEDNYVTENGYDCTLTINGSDTSITSINSLAIQVYEGTTNKVGVLVNAGTYSSNVSAYLPKDGSKVITEEVVNKLYLVSDAAASNQ